jgi:RNA polymerase sigma-70 factor (ECF subfamily)
MEIHMEAPTDQLDGILIAKCLQGNPRAQQELYHRYAKAMYNTALRMCGNSYDAEDALQESFVQVFQRLESYRGDATIGSWIKRIVVNHCINRLKSRRTFWVELNEPVHASIPEKDYEEYEPRFTVQTVKNALHQLPDGYRTVFSLYLLEGYDHGEIASILGISEATSKSQFSRARLKVREWLLQNEKS